MFALQFGNSFGYRLMGLVHILSAVVAFGPVLVYPTMRRTGDTSAVARLHMRLTFPALVVLWVAGMGLAGMGELKMSQLWLSLSIVVWVTLIATSWFLIRPALATTDTATASKLSAGVGITHLGLIVGLVLMIWKPGA